MSHVHRGTYDRAGERSRTHGRAWEEAPAYRLLDIGVRYTKNIEIPQS